MPINISEIITAIVPLNNMYRDPSTLTKIKIEMLWQIGDVLQRFHVIKPHSLGWAIQKETKEIIKRSTIIRGWKIRAIWKSRNELLRDLGEMKSISNLFEILPLIDPLQEVRENLSSSQLAEIYSKACRSTPKIFNKYISGIKKKYSHGRLGKPLNRGRHLEALHNIVIKVKKLVEYLRRIINDKNASRRDEFRKNVPTQDLMAFSNMCIALTTKENIRLYKRNWPAVSSTNNEEIQFLYSFFYSLLEKERDEERARLRRLVSADVFAQISDILSSLRSEEGVADYRERQKIAIDL